MESLIRMKEIVRSTNWSEYSRTKCDHVLHSKVKIQNQRKMIRRTSFLFSWRQTETRP